MHDRTNIKESCLLSMTSELLNTCEPDIVAKVEAFEAQGDEEAMLDLIDLWYEIFDEQPSTDDEEA